MRGRIFRLGADVQSFCAMLIRSVVSFHPQRVQHGFEIYYRCRVRYEIGASRQQDRQSPDLGYWYAIL
jgi:hypothetical protein